MSLECRCGHLKLVSVKKVVYEVQPHCHKFLYRRLILAWLHSVANLAKPTVEHVREYAGTVSVLAI